MTPAACLQVDIMPDKLKTIVSMCKLFHTHALDMSQRFLESVSGHSSMGMHRGFI